MADADSGMIDVGGRASARDDAVDAAIGAYLLAEHGHGIVGLDAGVQGVDALPRVGRGVGGLARELEGGAGDAEEVLVQERSVEAVDHHGRVHILEEPRLDELDLSAPVLFGGRADHVDAPLGELIPDGGEGGARPRPRGGDDIVATGMADAGERVVLA